MREKFRRRPAARSPVARTKVRAQEDAQFDPVALSLAIWLAVIVAATGFTRVVQDAVAQARIAQDAARAAGKVVAAPQAGTVAGSYGYVAIGG